MTKLGLFAALALAACRTPASDTTPTATSSPAPVAAPDAAGSTDGSCSDDADVPGDRARAMPAQPGAIAGCFGTGDDVDTFTLGAPANGGGRLVRVEITGSSKLWPCARVLAANGEEQVDICAEREGEPARGWLHVAAGTTAFLEAHPFVGFVGSLGYALRIEELPVDDSDEPNDTRQQATPLAIGTPHRALFSAAVNAPTMTPDFYRVELPAGGTLDVDVENPDSKVWFFVKLYDAEGKEVRDTSAEREGAPVHARAKLSKGVYFIELGLYVGELNAAGKGEVPERVTAPYTISATLD